MTKLTCPSCGFTTAPTTLARAEYGLSQHSCERYRTKIAAKARGEDRARIDRTPKPCLHKEAQHQHGTHACYVLDRCRCIPCKTANTAYERSRNRLTAYGRWQPHVDAGPVRAHVQDLQNAGLGLKRIAVLSGVSNGALSKLMYGKRQPDGTQVPSVQVRTDTAVKLFRVTAHPDLLGQTVCIPSSGTIRRLQALVAAGWSQSKLARELGMNPSNFTGVMVRPECQTRTARAVSDLYERLAPVPPPEDSHRDRIAASRARNRASAAGWPPPLWWDPEDLDDPTFSEHLRYLNVESRRSHHDVDPVAVEEAIRGNTTVTLTIAERREVIRHLHALGLNDQDIQRRTGITDRTCVRIRRELDLPANRAGAA
jgi:transcriptional regulator with XRE-family HTH domain